VTEEGFEYARTSYPSLTKVAEKITGAHWSGPRFFGLVRGRARRPPLNLNAAQKAPFRKARPWRASRHRVLHRKINLPHPDGLRPAFGQTAAAMTGNP
jgi:Protein of unknown function (DUF2924)